MDHETLEKNIKITTNHLLELVNEKCWNIVSNDCLYILSDVNKFEYSNFHELRKLKQKQNSKKIPQNLNFAAKTLNEYINDLYDVVLYVFRAENNKTIIEIEYLKKSDLDITYYQQIKHNSTMFHAKILMPPNQNHSKKFDVNWQHNNICYKLKRIFFNFQ